MALIKCPECGKSISDKAEKCPHCGIPSEYFPKNGQKVENNSESIDYEKLSNILISFWDGKELKKLTMKKKIQLI